MESPHKGRADKVLKAFEFTPARRLKLYWSDDQGESVGEYDQIPASALLQFPTPIGADITRALVANNWGLRQDSGETVWYRGVDDVLPDPVIGTTTRSSVALRILCAMLPGGAYRKATVIDEAFDLADRFLERMRR